MPHGVTAGTGQGDDALGPDSVVVVVNGLADLRVGVLEPVEGLFPRDALPLVLALFAVAEERPLEAVVVVDVLDHVQAAQAQTSLVVPEVGVALDLLELAVFDVREHAAAVVTPRSGPDRGAGHFITILVPTPVCFVQIMVVFVDHEKPPFHKRDTDKMNSYSSETPKHAYSGRAASSNLASRLPRVRRSPLPSGVSGFLKDLHDPCRGAHAASLKPRRRRDPVRSCLRSRRLRRARSLGGARRSAGSLGGAGSARGRGVRARAGSIRSGKLGAALLALVVLGRVERAARRALLHHFVERRRSEAHIVVPPLPH